MRLKLFHSFMHCEKGAALPYIVLGLAMLVGVTGTVVDMVRVQMVQAKLQEAMNQTAQDVKKGAHPADINETTKKYFTANFPEHYLGSNITSLAVIPESGTSYTLSAMGTVTMGFTQVLGIANAKVAAASHVELPASK